MDIVDNLRTQAEVALQLAVVVHNSNNLLVLESVHRWLVLMLHRLPPV